MEILISWILRAMVIFAVAYITPGVTVSDFFTALVVALILGIINTLLKPILLILTLPINIMTLGLFTFILNAVLILLVSKVVPGFSIEGFVPALVFGILLSIANTFIFKIFPK